MARRGYPPEFRRRVVDLVEGGKKVSEVASELGVSQQTIYVWLDAIPTYSEAIYFSLVTFTTLGYGEVTLGEEWRVLGALESANGVIIFGWSTAMVVAVLQRTLVPDATDGAS